MAGKDRRERVAPAAFDYGDPLARWFITEAFQIADTAEMVAQCGQHLLDGGIPLYRLNYLQRTLHPQIIGKAYVWRNDGSIDTIPATREILDQAEYRDNPLPLVFEEQRTIRVRLEGDVPLNFPLLRQLRAEGATDYVALPVIFTDGHTDALSVTSDRPGGFSRADLDRMNALQPLFARIVEIHNRQATAINLLDTYVGRNAGTRVLEGQILRGDGETIHAVLWYSDLRDFTRLSDSLSGDQIIDLLNDYFACMAEEVTQRQGEILKFIGDAMLAIFPISGDDETAVCQRALDAALAVLSAAKSLRDRRTTAGKAAIEFGLALHVGDVMYGNIGAPDRLDFTVIGPAVNYVARLEALTRDLLQPLLLSQAFAQILPDRMISAGDHEMKGLAQRQTVYTHAAAAAAPSLQVQG